MNLTGASPSSAALRKLVVDAALWHDVIMSLNMKAKIINKAELEQKNAICTVPVVQLTWSINTVV